MMNMDFQWDFMDFQSIFNSFRWIFKDVHEFSWIFSMGFSMVFSMGFSMDEDDFL